MNNHQYDYIIAGAGAAGLSLAYYLSKYSEKRVSIALLDKSEKKSDDRTWCFWGDLEEDFRPIVSKTWTKMSFYGFHGYKKEDIRPLNYHLVRGIDFYNYAREEIGKDSNICFIQCEMTGFFQEGEKINVSTREGNLIVGNYLFNSAIRPEINPLAHKLTLLQHFRGFVIECEEEVFEEDTARLMDFREEQHDHPKFYYILPITAKKALVELTVFSTEVWELDAYEGYLTDYIREKLGIDQYSIVKKEFGVIPMSDLSFRRKIGDRVINIGTPGGAVKPTTGYAFKNILTDSKHLAVSVLNHNVSVEERKYDRFRFYDQLLLSILRNEGDKGAKIFSELFHKNEFLDILTFMEEKSKFMPEIKMLLKLPYIPFVKAMIRTIPYWFRSNTRQTP